MRLDHLSEIARRRRLDVLERIYRIKAGHIGENLSALDVLTCLYYAVLRHRPAQPDWADRDRFVLSPGRCAEAQLAILADMGYFPADMLGELARPGNPILGQPRERVPGIEMRTDSPGHGLSVAAGMALGGKRLQRDFQVYALLSERELAEGSVWEAALFAARHELHNLWAVLDCPAAQPGGRAASGAALCDWEEKWRAFGWDAVSCDGHDMGALLSYFQSVRPADRPHVLIAHTVRGKGLPQAHIQTFDRVPDEAQYRAGVRALRAQEADGYEIGEF